MRLYVWRGETRNFGDELNTLLWPVLLPGLFDADGSALFLGIGSVLDARHSAELRKVVAGAGYGGYEATATLDGSWEIYWVRGPRTARQLGLPPAFGLGDPASLLPLVHTPAPSPAPGTIGFMPHFESLSRGAWTEAAESAGVTLIDPRGEPEAVLASIARCRLLLSEALHGAIVADALRVPWVALTPLAPVHRAKWPDWAETLDLTIRFQTLAASSPREWIETACASGRPSLRVVLAGVRGPTNRLGSHSFYLDRAAETLRRAAAAAPQLSHPAALARVQSRMLARLRTLRLDRARLLAARKPDPLHPGGKSAYDTASVG
jgi:succinoglycan biosynthesis protein ExoV